MTFPTQSSFLDLKLAFTSAAGNKRIFLDITYGTNSFFDILTLQG